MINVLAAATAVLGIIIGTIGVFALVVWISVKYLNF